MKIILNDAFDASAATFLTHGIFELLSGPGLVISYHSVGCAYLCWFFKLFPVNLFVDRDVTQSDTLLNQAVLDIVTLHADRVFFVN